MWFRTLVDSLKPRSSGTPARRSPPRPKPCRLQIEALEDRTVPSYTFTDIADTSPGSPYGGLPVGKAFNDRGQVAFVADLKSGGEAIYRTEADGRLTTIAQTGGLIRDFYLSPFMNDSSTVSFGADLTDGAQAVFTGSGGDLTRIADTEPASPFSSIPFPAPRIDARGAVYFRATLRSGGTGFFAGDGGPTNTLYLTGGEFAVFPSSFAHQVHGQFGSFRATLTSGPQGVFFGDGKQTDTIVTSGGTYRDFIGAECNDPGTVAITADLTAGGQVLLAANHGTLTPFVDTTGAYRQIIGGGQVSINNGGEIVFGATLKAGGSGLFNGPDPVADRVIAIGDELFGSTVVGLILGSPGTQQNTMNPRGLNNADQILFSANLADGRTVIVRADPDGEGHHGGGGHQGEDAFMAPSVLAAGLIGLSPSGDSMSSALAFAPIPLQGDGRGLVGLVADGFVATPAMTVNDVERLDQLFATGMEDETSVLMPKSRNPLSFADDIGVDVVSWE
jgi:hypothetical protein